MPRRKIAEWIEQNRGKHRCHCGCRAVIEITRNHAGNGIPKYLVGHGGRVRAPKSGYRPTHQTIDEWVESQQGRHRCHCGCDEIIVVTTHHYSNGIPQHIHRHVARLQKRVDDVIRFWPKVTVGEANECWQWKASKDPKGYGHIRSRNPLVKGLAHRLSYFIHNGPFDASLDVMHSCDNPSCVNPAHLGLGTHDQNMRDAAGKGRLVHKYQPEQVMKAVRLRGSGVRSKSVAEQTGVSPSDQCAILTGATWSHLTGIVRG